MSIILVDVDGVLADTHTEWVSRYNHDWHDNLKPEMVTTWALHEYVKPECGRKIYDYLSLPDFYDNVPRMLAASWGVKRLRELGHRVIFVSAGLYGSKIQWLGNHGFLAEFPYTNDHRFETANDLILANDKSLIKGDVMVDDRFLNFNGFNGRGILFTQPWNKDIVLKDDKIRRASNWYDVVIEVKNLCQDSVDILES